MKRIRFSLLTLVLCILSTPIFTSCGEEFYSLDEQAYSLATIYPLDEQTFYLVLDDGSKVWPAATNVNSYIPKSNQRVWLNYTLLSGPVDNYDNYIRINYLQDVLTKGVIDLTEKNKDSIGYDPVKVLDAWVGDDYMNIEFGFNSGGTQNHSLNLVRNMTKVTPDDTKVYLEFRHNAYEDAGSYGSTGYVSFDLRPYKGAENRDIEFQISALDYDNQEKVYTIKYRAKAK